MNAVSFLLIVFLLLSPLSVGFSYTLFGSLYGDDCLYHDVFCENLYINRPHLNLGLEFTSVTETRLKTVFDEFDNTIGEATVAENNNSYLKINNLSLMLPYRKILFGLRYTPLYDLSYKFREDIKDEHYVDIGKIEQKCEGDMKSYSSLLGITAHHKISTGILFNYLRGTLEDNYAKRFFDPEVEDSTYVLRNELDGFSLGICVQFRPSTKLNLFALYNSECHCKGDFQQTVNGDVIMNTTRKVSYPHSLSCGFEYLPMNVLPAKIKFVVNYTNWSSLKDNIYEFDLKDIIKLKLEAEHEMYESLTGSFGFSVESSYLNEKILNGSFLAGIGYTIGNLKLGLCCELQKRGYGIGDIKQFFELDDELRIEERMAKFILVITYSGRTRSQMTGIQQ